MKKGMIVLFFPLLIFVQVVQALATPCILCPGDITGSFYASLAAGAYFTHTTRNTHFVASGIGWPDDTYRMTDSGTVGTASVRLGYVWSRRTTWLPYYSFGIAYAHPVPVHLKGTVFQYSLPQFQNYRYTQHVQIQTLMLMAKLNLYRLNFVLPFITASVGPTALRSYHFHERALPDVTPRVSPGFSPHTNYNWGYQVGGGFDVIFCDTMTFGVEFTHSYLGKAQTGRGADYSSLTGENYSTESLKSVFQGNTLLFTLTSLVG